MRVAVTGANGHLGRRLLGELSAVGHTPVAIVRSDSAAQQVRAKVLATNLHIASYADEPSIISALDGCGACIHLVGIIRETPRSSFEDAHVDATEVLLGAAATVGVDHIVYYSLLGAESGSTNRCLSTRGTAEELFSAADIPVTVMRVGMVLGEGDYAAAALSRRARTSLNLVLRGSSLEQPIYAADLTAATVRALGVPRPGIHDVAGPESLTRASLIHRAAGVLGRQTSVMSLPVTPVLLAADVLDRVMTVSPLSRPMLEVLDHDDDVDPRQAADMLGIELTSLDATLRAVLG